MAINELKLVDEALVPSISLLDCELAHLREGVRVDASDL